MTCFQVPVERRTLPTDLPGTSHRRPYQKRGSQSPKDENAQVSCSLPETPIFARGCDIPRTPLRNTTDKSNSSRTTPRLNGQYLGTLLSFLKEFNLELEKIRNENWFMRWKK